MKENEMPGSGITRREALRKGTLAGLGMVWVTPAVTSIEMSPELAQATSGPKTSTTQPGGETSTSNGDNPSTSSDTRNTSTSVGNQQTSTSSSSQATSTEAGQPSTSADVKSQTTSQGATAPSSGPTTAPQDEVLADNLPFTGLPLEQLLPLAGGAVATGAALIRAARDKDSSDPKSPTT